MPATTKSPGDVRHTPKYKEEGLHYCADCHGHCGQTIEARSMAAELLESLAHLCTDLKEIIDYHISVKHPDYELADESIGKAIEAIKSVKG